jgi:hypothetical protein
MKEEPEKTCTRCGDDWPADTEFFRRLSSGRLAPWCRACEAEQKAEHRREQKTNMEAIIGDAI